MGKRKRTTRKQVAKMLAAVVANNGQPLFSLDWIKKNILIDSKD